LAHQLFAAYLARRSVELSWQFRYLCQIMEWNDTIQWKRRLINTVA
jgi:hypothetical protein